MHKPNQQKYPILYAAYGANTHRDHMRARCPTGKYVGNCVLHDFRLVFRGVADVVDAPGRNVVCALWEIMPGDETKLDTFEGYPRFYTKRYARIQYRGESRLVMFYVMAGKRHDVHEPPQSYEQTLREGYADCGMPTKQIDRAVRDAKRSNDRRKVYRGEWVQKDIRAKKKHEHKHTSIESVNFESDEYGGWIRWRPEDFVGNVEIE